MTEPRLLVAPVAGWSAVVVDVLLSRHLRPLLSGMTEGQRRELERTRRAVHVAALIWRDATSDIESAQAAPTEAAAGSEDDELDTAEAARELGVSRQRVRQLAERWALDGLARKVGRSWLVDRTAVLMYRDNGRRTA